MDNDEFFCFSCYKYKPLCALAYETKKGRAYCSFCQNRIDNNLSESSMHISEKGAVYPKRFKRAGSSKKSVKAYYGAGTAWWKDM